MALVKNTNQLKKRHFHDIREFEETGKPKIRFGVQVVRDFPPGCGIINDRQRFHFKRVDSNANSKIGKFSLNDNKLKKIKEVVVSQKEKTRREQIEEAMKMFYEVYKELFQVNRGKEKGEKIAHWRVPGEAVKVVKNRLKWIEVGKTLGSISGVQVGDTFRYRSQLQMIGVHCQPQSGIDYMDVRGKNLAISIVDSNRYQNDRKSCDVMKYCGQGGVRFSGNKEVFPEDQKLERGNLALKNSKDKRNEVRVVRKIHEVGGSNDVFVYDGLYIVKKYEQEKGDNGKMVYMFELERVAGQPQLLEMLNKN